MTTVMESVGPLVSTIIPSYNRAGFVIAAVESALAQTYEKQEIIVIDDGSTDQTKQRLERYAKKIRYVYQENQVVAAARNTGVRVSRGEWFAFLDADDLWSPDKLERQLECINQKSEVGLVHTNVFFFGAETDHRVGGSKHNMTAYEGDCY